MACDSLVLLGPCVTRPMCIGSRCVQICSAALTLSHTGHWKFQHGTTWQKNSQSILKDVLLCYMKMAKATIRLPTPSKWTAAQWLRSSSVLKKAGSIQNRPRVGRPKKLSARAERHIQMLSLKDRRRNPVCIAAEIEEVGFSMLVLRPYAAHYIKLVCMAVTPEGSLFWRRYTRKPPNS